MASFVMFVSARSSASSRREARGGAVPSVLGVVSVCAMGAMAIGMGNVGVCMLVALCFVYWLYVLVFASLIFARRALSVELPSGGYFFHAVV